MIYKHMYCGYKKGGDSKVAYKENPALITRSATEFEDKIFVYYETKGIDLYIDEVVKFDTVPFPGGEKWCPMPEIFHYFTPQDDSQWQRKETSKTPIFAVNKLNFDKIASYIYLHVNHQNQNQYNFDKFFSIFIYGDTIIMYREEPEEKITWQEIEGRCFSPNRPDWSELMDQHFKQWPDGEKKWIPLKTL